MTNNLHLRQDKRRQVPFCDMSIDQEDKLIPQFLRIHKARIGKHWIWPEHTNTEIELVLIKKGQMRCSIDGEEFRAHSGDCYFVQPGQVHHEEILSKHLDIFTLRFALLDSREKSRPFITKCHPKQQCLRKFERKTSQLFEKILQLIWNEKRGTEREIEKAISDIINLIKKHIDEQSPGKTPEKAMSRQHLLVRQAVDFIKQNTNKNVTVSQVADHCCICPCYLAHIFKDRMGIPPVQYILQQRIDQAKRLLADESLYVYEVANQLGYKDSFYFSRQFKKNTGLSPQAYRIHLGKVYL